MRVLCKKAFLLAAFHAGLLATMNSATADNSFDKLTETVSTGGMAIVVGARSSSDARKLNDVLVLDPAPSVNRISRRQAGWYVVNHFKEVDNDAPESRKSYLAISIVTIHESTDRFAPELFLYRNSGWASDSFITKFKKDGLSRAYLDKNGHRFSELHNQDDQELLSQYIKTIYHGTPEKSEDNSWDSKRFWGDRLNGISECEDEKFRCTLRSYMIGFTQNTDGSSSKPIVFSSNPWSVERAYFRTFSPVDDIYSRDYIIEFTD